MSGFISQISAISALEQAIDGTRRPTRVTVSRKPAPLPGRSRWRCPVCGRRSGSAEDQARHVGYEASRLFKALAKVSPEKAEMIRERQVDNLPVSEDRLSLVRSLHAEGLGRGDIARLMGTSEVSVWRMAGRLGLSFDRNRRYGQDQYDLVRELHAQGLSRFEVATHMDASPDAVSRIARRLGLTFSPVRAARRPLTQEDRDHVKHLHGEGRSAAEIAHLIGRRISTVYQVARELGVDFRRRSPRRVPSGSSMSSRSSRSSVRQADYDAVKSLHAQGKGRNEIMRIIDRSGRTVSRIAAELGLSFERGEMVKTALEARKADRERSAP